MIIQPTFRKRLCFAGIALLIGASAQAQTIKRERELDFAYPKVGYPPYLMPHSSNDMGIVSVMLKEVCDRLNYRLNIRSIPENRIAVMQANGSLDATGTAKEWVTDPGMFYWSDPIIIVEDNIIFRIGNDQEIGNISELSGMTLGAMQDFLYPSFEDPFKQGHIKRQNTRTFRSLLKMVQMNRVDAIILDKNVARWTIRNNKELDPQSYVIAKTGFDPAHYRLRLSKTRQMKTFLPLFNAEMKEIKQSGLFDKILQGYR